MKEIQLSQGRNCGNKGKYVALVDDEDFENINKHKWNVMKRGKTLYTQRHITVDGKRTTIGIHNAVLNGKWIDHIDHDGLNNTRSNLRFCTRSENNMNQRKKNNCTSIYKGVYFSKNEKKWKSTIAINGKNVHLGYFVSETEAAKAYNAKAIELFCEFANLNIIPNE